MKAAIWYDLTEGNLEHPRNPPGDKLWSGVTHRTPAMYCSFAMEKALP